MLPCKGNAWQPLCPGSVPGRLAAVSGDLHACAAMLLDFWGLVSADTRRSREGECAGCMLKTGIAYKLTFNNGKVYIGITRESLSARVRRHIANARAGKPYALSSAIRKHGEDSFSSEVIGRGTWEELKSIEVAAIAFHNALGNGGYNMTGGGEGTLCVTQAPETKAKIAASLSGRTCSEEHRRRVGLAQRGKTIPEETRQKMRLAAQARVARTPMSQEQKEKISAALKGRKIPPDVVAKRNATRFAR